MFCAEETSFGAEVFYPKACQQEDAGASTRGMPPAATAPCRILYDYGCTPEAIFYGQRKHQRVIKCIGQVDVEITNASK